MTLFVHELQAVDIIVSIVRQPFNIIESFYSLITCTVSLVAISEKNMKKKMLAEKSF